MGKNPTREGAQEEDYEDTPVGWAARWSVEFKGAKKWLEVWRAEAEEANRRYMAVRSEKQVDAASDMRVNLYTANVQTIRSLLYGKPPNSTVKRRFTDFGDDVGRVGGEILERVLNTDIDRPADGFKAALFHALDDRLVSGLGVVKMEYVRDEEQGEETPAKYGDDGSELAPAIPPQPILNEERVESRYIHWRDFTYSPCRVWEEARWAAVRKSLTRADLRNKFGAVGDQVPLNSKTGMAHQDDMDATKNDPWARSDVWEIWDKEHECVWYYVDGFRQVLVPVDQESMPSGCVRDPLEIEGFWPFPEPMFANASTGKLVPIPDWHYARDLYEEVDKQSTRIGLLVDAIRAAGVYDQNATSSVGKLLENRGTNKLYPVAGWAAFGEKGGLKGVIDWLPLDMIVVALDKLREVRQETISMIYQVTGMSDIMRGEATEQATATEQAIKAKFASVRTQSFQDEFARFAGEAQHIKAQIIAKFFDPNTIVERSNMAHTPDAQLVPQAIEFIKSNAWCYRVEVKPESINLTDYTALRQENVEIMQGMAMFFANMLPAVQPLGPSGVSFVMEMAQWFLSRTKGATAVESIFEQALAQYKQMQAQQAAQGGPPPDPKIMAQQMKSQGEMQKTQLDAHVRQQEIASETQSNMVQEQHKGRIAILVDAAKQRNKIMETIKGVIPDKP